MKKILITGASGFIGHDLSLVLSKKHEVIGLYNRHKPSTDDKISWVQTDLLCKEKVIDLLQKYYPDIVIHCAAIAHQGFFKADKKTYFDVNSIAAENIAMAACEANMPTHFIFLSSISVYGENNLTLPIDEFHTCRPTSDYGKSKLDAENRLLRFYKNKKEHALTILRLAPVYDKEWSFNLDRRVMLPFRLAYVKYGSGKQQLSALARPNLVDFIRLIISKSNDDTEKVEIINVTDKEPFTFTKIIDTFLKSSSHPVRPVITIPITAVSLLTRIIGLLFPDKREWIYGCYEKLASSLIFDNKKMLNTGFEPKYNVKAIYS
jgi:nucleoside-diphosphate-sugar epimerase